MQDTGTNHGGGGIDLGRLLDRFDQEPEMRAAVEHNIQVLKCIRGGLRMAEAHALDFDPRADYWHPPERRLAVAYLADRWSGRVAPVRAVRELALLLVEHFEHARRDRIVTYLGVDSDEVLKAVASLIDHARRLGPLPVWDRLRSFWPRLPAAFADHLIPFLEEARSSDSWERSFKHRIPWLAYLGSGSLEDVAARRAFFYGYANLWTTTNAYVRAGAQSFASILQNTKVPDLLGPVRRWATGESPVETGFPTLGKDDETPQDRARYSTVIELHGFLNLHRQPFYNNMAEKYREWFSVDDPDPYQLMAGVGSATASWLGRNPAAVPRLATLFRRLTEAPVRTRVEFESVDRPRFERRAREAGDELADAALVAELDREARSELEKLGEREAAAAALHLLLDSEVYRSSLATPAGPPPEPPDRSPAAVTTVRAKPAAPIEEPRKATMKLPEALRAPGERALAYLRAGLHVLFAGAPGTGKTTLAQFAGFAWDHELSVLPGELPRAAAPLTTVGNSAWSPFHTIGGLVPRPGGGFERHPGIFIDPESAASDPWRLRNGAIVLDEMNRADLDRCIGELYPLLSGSVECVSPAGLPGVSAIVTSPRFRVLATVNDATVDDIVFPISEGLARRFQRIELRGAARDDVLDYLDLDPESPDGERASAAVAAVRDFFDVVREKKLLAVGEDDDRLPFGVGYFALLRSWLVGRLELPPALQNATSEEQARDLLAASLRVLGRSRNWEVALRAFESRE